MALPRSRAQSLTLKRTNQVANAAYGLAAQATADAGGIVEIERQTISGAVPAVTFSGTWTDYAALMIVGTGISGSAAAASLRIALSDDDGATTETVQACSHWYSTALLGITTTFASNALPTILTADAGALAAANTNAAFSVTIFDTATLAVKKRLEWTGISYAGNAHTVGSGVTASACDAINRLQLTFNAGNIDAMTAILYGLK